MQSHGVSTEPRSSALGGAPDIVDAQLLLAAEHTSLSGSWWLNLENGETVWSPEMYEIFGLDPASGPSREGVERLRHPDDAASVTAVIEATMTSGGSFSIAYRVIRPSGEVRLLDARGWVESRANGHGRYARGTVHDITNAALLARGRRLADEQRELILRATGDGICGLDALGRVTFFNPAFQQLVRRPAAGICNELLHDLVHRDPSGRELHPPADCPYSGEDHGRVSDIDADFCPGDGAPLEVSYVRVGVHEGDFAGAVLSLRDATEQRAAARRLHSSLEQIRSLSTQRGHLLSQLAAAEERERLRIAADIHDDSIQTLRAIELMLERRRDQIEDERGTQVLDEARLDIHLAAARLRGLMLELLPPLPKLTLNEAVRAYCETLLNESALEFAVHGEAGELSAERYLLAYRLIQEAVRNARRHSGGSRIEVTLESSGNELEIVVSDDGVGVQDAACAEVEQGGLRILRQRIEAAGGTALLGPGLGSSGLAVAMRISLEETWPL